MRAVTCCIALGLVLAACKSEQEGGTAETGETPAPECPTVATPAGLNPTVDVPAALDHAQQLRFLTGAPYGERRPLTEITDTGPPERRRFGLSAVVEVEPEACSHLNDAETLAGPNGRIVARINAERAYPKLGIPAGTSYLWIQNLVIQGDSGTAEGIVFPAPDGAAPQPRRVRVDYHSQLPNRVFPEARLLFTPDDDELWVSCVRFGCCYVEERLT